MSPAAPDRTAGFLDSCATESFANPTNPPACPLPLPAFTTAVLTPDAELFFSPCLSSKCADSLVSSTQRPAMSAISGYAWATWAPTLKTAPSRGNPRFFDANCSAARKSSTAVGLPMTARPSPSLINWMSASIVGSSKRGWGTPFEGGTTGLSADAGQALTGGLRALLCILPERNLTVTQPAQRSTPDWAQMPQTPPEPLLCRFARAAGAGKTPKSPPERRSPSSGPRAGNRDTRPAGSGREDLATTRHRAGVRDDP
jgi:hypothetical protein